METQTGTITIDGKEIPYTQGQTVMDAALAAGVYIPHLCHRPGLKPHGSCKLCVVDLDGRSVSSCTMPAAAGQQISSETAELNEQRKAITQMLFIEGNHICPSCEKTGDCSLQAAAYHLGMTDGHFQHFYPRREVDASHPTIMLDRDRCILCELCVRASRDVDGKNVFAIAGRGLDAHLVVNTASGKLADSDIALGDLAVSVCPVGAILVKERGYEVPIGQRIFDRHQFSETGLDTVAIIRERHAHE
ncbi:MAG TPA: 2Fe-2S iron-sulfur cluster-binding protein [Sideroxyarcus sp.]|nr:2Fe-2S iron-sulfur cluster-binding protein [Sideroxyarcus sp.]